MRALPAAATGGVQGGRDASVYRPEWLVEWLNSERSTRERQAELLAMPDYYVAYPQEIKETTGYLSNKLRGWAGLLASSLTWLTVRPSGRRRAFLSGQLPLRFQADT